MVMQADSSTYNTATKRRRLTNAQRVAYARQTGAVNNQIYARQQADRSAGLQPLSSYAYRQDIQNAGREAARPAPAGPAANQRAGGGGSGGRGYGGGGGGGGGGGAAAGAQSQLDYLMQLLRGKSWTSAPLQGERDSVAAATAADQAASTGAYNSLDQWLGANATNPYANVKLQRADVGPSYNPYLESQGVAPLNPVQQNPDDAYGAFQNVLSLLGANQLSGNTSRQAESQMARTYSGQGIGAVDNAMLAQIGARETAQQQTLDAEKRKLMIELAALIGQGAKAPDLTGLV